MKFKIPQENLKSFKRGLKDIEWNNWDVEIVDSRELSENTDREQEVTLNIKPFLEKEKVADELFYLVLLITPIIFIFFIVVAIFSWR